MSSVSGFVQSIEKKVVSLTVENMTYSVVMPLVEVLDGAAELSVDLFRRALEKLEISSTWLEDMLEELREGDDYHRVLLHGGDGYEIVLAVWPEGTGTLVHNHGASDSFGMVKVLEGEIFNHLYHRDEVDCLQLGAQTVCKPGDMIGVPKGLLHRMGNACKSGPAASLHVYSPAIVDVSYWDPETLAPCQ